LLKFKFREGSIRSRIAGAKINFELLKLFRVCVIQRFPWSAQILQICHLLLREVDEPPSLNKAIG
jgi:hypothetical protein